VEGEEESFSWEITVAGYGSHCYKTYIFRFQILGMLQTHVWMLHLLRALVSLHFPSQTVSTPVHPNTFPTQIYFPSKALEGVTCFPVGVMYLCDFLLLWAPEANIMLYEFRHPGHVAVDNYGLGAIRSKESKDHPSKEDP